MKYRDRVRTITIGTNHHFQGGMTLPLSKSLYSSILFAAPLHQDFLPSITSLDIRLGEEDMHLRLLLGQKLEHLSIVFTDTPDLVVSCFLEDVASKAPCLKSIKIGTQVTQFNWDDELAACIRGLDHLESISLPPCWITPRCIFAISQSSTVFKVWSQDGGPSSSVVRLVVDTNLSSFASTTKLGIAVENVESLSFLISEELSTLPMLQELHVGLPVGSSEAVLQLEPFLSQLAVARPTIRSLGLDLFDQSCTPSTTISLHNLRPLLALSNLTKFTIRHANPLQVGGQDLRGMLEAWPLLTELSLCADPIERYPSTPSGLPFEVLRIVARHAPNIRHLGLYLDGNHHLVDDSPFELLCLNTLDVGSSSIKNREDISSIAFFLASLSTRIISIKVAPGEALLTPSTPNSASDQSSSSAWKEVASVYIGIMRMREERRIEASDREKKLEQRLQEEAQAREELVTQLGNEITLRKQMEEKMREMEQRLASLHDEIWDT